MVPVRVQGYATTWTPCITLPCVSVLSSCSHWKRAGKRGGRDSQTRAGREERETRGGWETGERCVASLQHAARTPESTPHESLTPTPELSGGSVDDAGGGPDHVPSACQKPFQTQTPNPTLYTTHFTLNNEHDTLYIIHCTTLTLPNL